MANPWKQSSSESEAEEDVVSSSCNSSPRKTDIVDAAVTNRAAATASFETSAPSSIRTGGKSPYCNGLPPPNARDGDQPSPAKWLKYEDNGTIKAIVGARKACFNIHKQFVSNTSPIFQGARNSSLKKAWNDEVYLPEAGPVAFNIFVEWIYTGVINFPKLPLEKISDVEIDEWWMLVAKLYVLGVYLQSTSFGNAVVDSVCLSLRSKKVRRSPLGFVINFVYDSTVEESGLRRLLVALSVWNAIPTYWSDGKDWKSRLTRLPAKYSHDQVIKLQRRIHQLDQNPFANDQTCQIFRDTEFRSACRTA